MKAIALKEWAAAVRSLERGEQILIMRKGGIREETRDFQVVSPAFYFLPTYEHQRKELFKPAYQSVLDETLTEWDGERESVSITSYAEVTDDIEVEDEATLKRLYPYHIWTEDFAEQRLKWKRKQPLHVLLLRVYCMKPSYRLEMQPDFLGCKSWVELEELGVELKREPVLSEEEFRQRRDELLEVLEKKQN